MTQNPSNIADSGSSVLNLNVSGFEETVLESASQGRDNSFTLNLTASSPDVTGRMKPGAVIFTKRLSINDLASPNYKLKAGDHHSEDELVAEPITVTLPPMTTDISVSVSGDQSSSLATETIAIDTAKTGTSTLFLNVDTLPSELAAYTEESPVDVSLFTATETMAISSTGNQKAGDPSDESDFLSFTIDPNDGALVPAVKIRSGDGGTGSIGSFDEGGGLGFVTQKSKEEGSDFSAFIRANDGTMKPLVLPAGSDQTTLAYDTTTKMLYMLKPAEDRLLVQQQNEDGSLKTIQELTTGQKPAMIYLARVARLAMVVNKQDQTISVFSMNESGSLTELQTIKTQQNPTAIEMDPTGRFFYVALESGGISRFTMGENNRLAFVDTTATGSLTGLKIGDTGQALIGVPKVLDKQCEPGEKCKSRRWKKFTKALRSIAKVIVNMAKLVICPPIGKIHLINNLNPICGWNPIKGIGLHWPRELIANEVKIQVGDSLTNDWKPSLDIAIAEWSQSSRVNLKKITGRGACRFIMGRIEVCNSNYGETGWSGMAQPLFLNEHIIAVSIRLNDHYFRGTGDTPEERRLVMCQEIGHGLGLYLDIGNLLRGFTGHRDIKLDNSNLGTCMDYTDNPVKAGISNISPDQYDFDYLKKIHDHYDDVINIDKAILNILPPISLGSPIRGVDGKAHFYQLDIGRGYKVVTEIMPARRR